MVYEKLDCRRENDTLLLPRKSSESSDETHNHRPNRSTDMPMVDSDDLDVSEEHPILCACRLMAQVCFSMITNRKLSLCFCLITTIRFRRDCQKSNFEVEFYLIQWKSFFTAFYIRKAENPWTQRLSALLAGVPERIWTSDPTLRSLAFLLVRYTHHNFPLFLIRYDIVWLLVNLHENP